MNPRARQQLQSARHALSLQLSRWLRWSPGAFREQSAGGLVGLKAAEAERIARLQANWAVDFAATLDATSARNNYAYLDALDQAFRTWATAAPRGGSVVDMGCAGFWYAAALHRFFEPGSLTGVEVDGFRRLRNGRTRRDYALGYLRDLPGSAYLVADYATLALPADVVTAWFPFVTPEPLLAWRLPLSLLNPDALFASVRRNLRPGGILLMANHAGAEAAEAARLAGNAGLHRRQHIEIELALVARTHSAALSLWAV